MKISFNIADDKWPRVRDGVCGATGYTGPNTDADKQAHVEKMCKKFLRDIAVNYEAQVAAQAAHAAAVAAAGGELDLG